jgi:hypothetical protein
MDRLPPEIIEQILVPLVDDGRTGCVLAAVSLRFRRIFAPWRYYSIGLRGPRQIRAFIDLVERTRQPTKPSWWKRRILDKPDVRVRHLFLCDCLMRPDDPFAAIAWADWQPSLISQGFRYVRSRAAVRVIHDNRGSSQRAWYEASVEAPIILERLLELLSDDLTHLHLSTWITPWLLLPNVVLPMLTELTCDNPRWLYPYQRWDDEMNDVCWRGPDEQYASTLPALRRLHIVASGKHEFGAYWRIKQLPPLLTHLYLSEAWSVPEVLGQLSLQPAFSPELLPHSLITIIIAPHAHSADCRVMMPPPTKKPQDFPYPLARFRAPSVHADRPPDPDPEWPRQWDWPAWRAAASEKANLVDRVFVVCEQSVWIEERLHEDWLERARGGRACWVDGIPLALGN